jgi:circadian clock protein KaiC
LEFDDEIRLAPFVGVSPAPMTTRDPEPTNGKVPIGIEGLDELLDGGLTPNRMYLIEGDPGTGKTTLAIQFLLNGRDRGERTLLVTLSETAVEMRAAAASHGWSLDGIELFELASADGIKPNEQYTLYHPAEVELGETVKAVLEVIARAQPTRVVFDSLSELRLLARDPLRYRRQILALKQFFAGRDCTVLLLDDHADAQADLQLRSISHGVVLLEQLPFEYGRARRRIRIVKVRGVPTVEGFHDFLIRRGGLRVFPQLRAPQGYAPSKEPISSGIPELDQLLGGGLNWGTTTLLMAPAGAGKSTIAAQYLSAVTTSGSIRAAAYLFDERLRTFVDRCDALGMQMSERVADGRISVAQIEPGDLSPGEFSYRVRDDVETRGARAVVIDSLNGYLQAIPQSDTPLARVHELISYLNERGVLTLLILAQHGIVGPMMSAPLDVSYLADCVIMLRFFEARGSVRRAISVVKKRSGHHESTIREFQLGPDRVRVGGALSEFQGVLTGVPRFTGTEGRLLVDGD